MNEILKSHRILQANLDKILQNSIRIYTQISNLVEVSYLGAPKSLSASLNFTQSDIKGFGTRFDLIAYLQAIGFCIA